MQLLLTTRKLLIHLIVRIYGLLGNSAHYTVQQCAAIHHQTRHCQTASSADLHRSCCAQLEIWTQSGYRDLSASNPAFVYKQSDPTLVCGTLQSCYEYREKRRKKKEKKIAGEQFLTDLSAGALTLKEATKARLNLVRCGCACTYDSCYLGLG